MAIAVTISLLIILVSSVISDINKWWQERKFKKAMKQQGNTI